jgi:hypothetical protein
VAATEPVSLSFFNLFTKFKIDSFEIEISESIKHKFSYLASSAPLFLALPAPRLFSNFINLTSLKVLIISTVLSLVQ